MVAPTHDQSLTDLLRELKGEATELVRQEVRLARAELAEDVGQVRSGGISLTAGSVLGFAGLVFVLLAATFALSYWVEPWLAALIVGGIALIVGLFMLAAGRSRLRGLNPRPERTLQTLRRDVRAVKEQGT